MRAAALGACVALTLVACGDPAEERFTAGRALLPCEQNLPVCPGVSAACVLDNGTYTQKKLPDDLPLQFIVEVEEPGALRLELFFQTQRDAGLDTRVEIFGPGCTEIVDAYQSEGRDLFAAAGTDRRFDHEFELSADVGEHLVSLVSDMQAQVLLRQRFIPDSSR